MARGRRKVQVLTVKAPRHNAQHINEKVAAQVKIQAKARGVRADIAEPRNHELNQAIESASEWNSLLMTARAERGPQWDIGTQQFHVEEYSELYYNPTLLRESAKKQWEEETASDEPQQESQPLPIMHSTRQSQPPPQMQTPMREQRDYRSGSHGPPPNYPYGGSPMPMRGGPSSGPPPGQYPGPASPYNKMPPQNQYFQGRPEGMGGGMNPGMGMGGGMNSPMGGGMNSPMGGGMPGGGNMGPMGMNMNMNMGGGMNSPMGGGMRPGPMGSMGGMGGMGGGMNPGMGGNMPGGGMGPMGGGMGGNMGGMGNGMGNMMGHGGMPNRGGMDFGGPGGSPMGHMGMGSGMPGGGMGMGGGGMMPGAMDPRMQGGMGNEFPMH